MVQQEPGTVAITMAGMGSRFEEAGYERPKYEIEVLGRPLFDWSMAALAASLEEGWTFSFATLRAEDAKPFLQKRCTKLAQVIELDQPTDG